MLKVVLGILLMVFTFYSVNNIESYNKNTNNIDISIVNENGSKIIDDNIYGGIYFGNDYIIDLSSVVTTYEQGELLLEREYDEDDIQTMKIEQKFNPTFSFNLNIKDEELKQKLGFDRDSVINISDSFTPKYNSKKIIRCYKNIEKKSFNIYEDDMFNDDFVGTYYSTRVIGCIFTVIEL